MLEKSCNEFIETLASKAPVPGGGGASALVGALGMALGCMVGNLTLGKKKYADVEADIQALLVRSEALIDRLKALVAQDAEVFFPLSQAYGLPQGTDAEKAAREATLQQALIGATQVPLDIALACLEAIRLQAEYARIGTRIAISDAGVGVAFCKAALQGAALNVWINTKIMKDERLKAAFETQLEQAIREGTALADQVYATVEAQLR